MLFFNGDEWENSKVYNWYGFVYVVFLFIILDWGFGGGLEIL